MASALIDKGMPVAAIVEARKAKEMSGVSTRPTAFLGYALAQSGNFATAGSELQQLLKLSNEAVRLAVQHRDDLSRPGPAP